MKKFFLAILMAVCASGMHAQTEDVENVDVEVEATDTLSDANEANRLKTSKIEKKTSTDNFDEMASMFRQFSAMALANQKSATQTDYSKIYFPVEGKGKFFRRHHIVQQISIAGLGGGDSDDEDTGSPASNLSDEDYGERQDKYDKPHFGGSIGLSFLFIPGKVEGDNLRINKFGAGYSLGLVTALDRQDHYGVTCDFLFKLGAETGYAHKMGMGLDALIGTGKSGGISYDVPNVIKDDDDILEDPYTKWCFKYGAQLWVRSGLLSSGLDNTHVRLFFRYVYSKNPDPEYEEYNGGITINDWKEESWQIGIELCYEF